VRLNILATLLVIACATFGGRVRGANDTAFFESKIRPLLVKRCYECHSEEAKMAEGGLLLDRRSGWMEGGDTGKAVIPGQPDASLLIEAVRRMGDIQMPLEEPLAANEVALLVEWVRRGAPGPRDDVGDTEFSRLGDQEYLFAKAKDHWAFQPVEAVQPPAVDDPNWNQNAIDRFVYTSLIESGLAPSPRADSRTLVRRLSYDLTGLPPSSESVDTFIATAVQDRLVAVAQLTDQLLDSPAFGEHIGRMWLDVVRYADTDSFYRPDTRTPHYFPFAFTYRDYVIEAFNTDKPFDQFIKEQLAADLLTPSPQAAELAALGFLTVGPHANRNQSETVDDWIDVTTRGLMGLTAACARCHDHKYEPIPTADYYALHGVFSSVIRVHPLDEKKQPLLPGYQASEKDKADYAKKRAAIDAKISGAGGKKAKNNNRSIAKKIRETELAQLLSFHPGAPAHTMVVKEKARPVQPVVFIRGDPSNRGRAVSRRFLTVLDPSQTPFAKEGSGRLELAERIVDPRNPLTARVFVNRVWGMLIGSHLVDTPSDFGLQGSGPSHPELLDWLAADFVSNGWSVKRLVRQIVTSRTYQQSSRQREQMAAIDPQNRWLWRANRKRLSIEAIRDSMLAVSGNLDRTPGGRPSQLWGDKYTRRRTIYGYINRFNLDPTLRAFDFPAPMQTHPARDESIVAPQALFTLNSPFVIDQAKTIAESEDFVSCETDGERIAELFQVAYQRSPADPEVARIERFLKHQAKFAANKRTVSPWAVLAQTLLMSNEFQYVD